MIRKITLVVVALIMSFYVCAEQDGAVRARILIDTEKGHALEEGCSGFNVRIADKAWSYDHPDFREAVHGLQPGWLRYFSGTMGDAFNSATGLYDKDYTLMFDHRKQYDKGYLYTDMKGPHRIIDLYELLGEVGGKLVVTVNGFSETPQIAGELARFCKNNNIEVEAWQFCNEPYFYVPHRKRYWWNDGYDYAAKMKPYADSIRAVFPEAKLALNCTWDGIWGFMKEIHQYQEEEGAYWDVFSKHSYAPHVGGKESFDKAYRRLNTKLIEATSPAAMQEIEDYTEEGIPMLITEFGVWNSPLNGIMSAIYNVEYTLRQLEHPNAFLIGSHEVSNKFLPANNRRQELIDAYNSGNKIDTKTLRTGIRKDDEGKALEILHEATNNSVYTWKTEIEGGAKVPGLKGAEEVALYARGFKGINGYDYLAVTNRSGKAHLFEIEIDGSLLDVRAQRAYMASDVAQNKNIPQHFDEIITKSLQVPPYSLMLIKWKSEDTYAPTPTRIYKTKLTEKGVELTWWKREFADAYNVYAGKAPSELEKVKSIKGADNTHVVLSDLPQGEKFYFAVEAKNKQGLSGLSATTCLNIALPQAPQIFKVAPRDTSITVMWRSVPDALGYKVMLTAEGKTQSYDAKNVFGYRVSGLQYDVPYTVSVIAYNGLGEGSASPSVVAKCDRQLPLMPRNISAKQTKEGFVFLEWEVNDHKNKDVKYRLFRGLEPHNFTALADGIVGNNYLDETAEKDVHYYYTVKSYNAAGECNFYPNVASLIERDKVVNIEVQSIERTQRAFVVTVRFDNIKADGDVYYGITYSDVSYLNVEETALRTDKAKDGLFVVEIPFSALKEGRTYAIKGFVNTNGSPISSMPPYNQVKF